MDRISAWRGVDRRLTGASVALGNFDGVHLGHQAVIEAARLAGQHAGAPLGVVVFRPHPRRFFQPDCAPFRLTSDAMRAELLAELGVARLYELPFDRDLSLMTAEAFVADVLAGGLNVRHVTVGDDYQFGRNRTGDAALLQRLGAHHGFGVSVVGPVGEGARASSSGARAALQAGDPAAAAAILTRPWTIDGLVTRGDQRGRTIGFPTANVSLGLLVRPRLGVYAVRVRVDGEERTYDGVANIGSRPTFDGVDERLEAHVFDFDGDLYGRRILVSLIAFIRPETRFDGLEALKAQIAVDVAEARARLA